MPCLVCICLNQSQMLTVQLQNNVEGKRTSGGELRYYTDCQRKANSCQLVYVHTISVPDANLPFSACMVATRTLET